MVKKINELVMKNEKKNVKSVIKHLKGKFYFKFCDKCCQIIWKRQ